MKQFKEPAEIMNHPSVNVKATGNGWDSDAVKPLSNRPEDTGLYLATSYDDFFRSDLEKTKNGAKPPK